MNTEEGRLHYTIVEMTTQSKFTHISDWSSNHLRIAREDCTPEFFTFVYNYPAYFSVFVLKWREHYTTTNVSGSTIVKPDADTLIIIDPTFQPIYESLDICEKIEASRIFMETHV